MRPNQVLDLSDRHVVGICHYRGANDFAPFEIGYSKHGHFAYPRMRLDYGFHLAGRDVLATTDDHFVDASV